MCSPVKTISNVVKSPTRTLSAVGTLGGSEIWGRRIPGVPQLQKRLDKGIFGQGSDPSVPSMGMENPAQVLAQTGGAPLLANIAMGADIGQTLAGYFGSNNYDEFYKELGPEDQKLVDGVRAQLTSIQQNTNLRNQAVEKIVNDFPNIATQAAQARKAAGGEFDEVTRGYLDKALSQSAAKYAAGGNLSSGAMAEAAGRVGADYGMQKLNYMDNRGDNAYGQGVQGWQARYNEANALRNFQNLMTQGAAGQGFSAVQASLNRNNQAQMANFGAIQQQNAMNQQNENAMFGALGTFGGMALGGMLGGPMGAGISSQIGRTANSGAATGGMGAFESGFSGPATPGYARNNVFTPRLNYGGR